MTGGSGQLGGFLDEAIHRWDPHADVWMTTRRDLDIAEEGALIAALDSVRPQIIVNCAAWTAVDDAESNPLAAARVNVEAPRLMADWLGRQSTGTLLHVSTDYVFGDGVAPYREDTPGCPLNVYGRTKWEGERAVAHALPDRSLIVRTSALFGGPRHNFVRSIARQAAEGRPLRVVDDQWCQPTSAKDLSRLIAQLAVRHAQGDASGGIYHATNGGRATWYDLACEVLKGIGADPDAVVPVSTSDFPRPARRPVDAHLVDTRLGAAGIDQLRDWRQALAEALPDAIQDSVTDSPRSPRR